MNKNTLINIIMLATGATIGSVVTWRLLKAKYERITREEIDSVIETFSNRQNATEETEQTEEVVAAEPDFKKQLAEKPSITEYASIIKDQSYGNMEKPTESKGVDDVDGPYTISPSEFGENGYETVTLYYYESDDILADDDDNPIEDVDGLVGKESLSTFGEYEDDAVFVRNDKTQIDYEILMCARSFADVAKYNPHSAEDE